MSEFAVTFAFLVEDVEGVGFQRATETGDWCGVEGMDFGPGARRTGLAAGIRFREAAWAK
jgi:hypothetical protein